MIEDRSFSVGIVPANSSHRFPCSSALAFGIARRSMVLPIVFVPVGMRNAEVEVTAEVPTKRSANISPECNPPEKPGREETKRQILFDFFL